MCAAPESFYARILDVYCFENSIWDRANGP